MAPWTKHKTAGFQFLRQQAARRCSFSLLSHETLYPLDIVRLLARVVSQALNDQCPKTCPKRVKPKAGRRSKTRTALVFRVFTVISYIGLLLALFAKSDCRNWEHQEETEQALAVFLFLLVLCGLEHGVLTIHWYSKFSGSSLLGVIIVQFC